MLVRGDSELIVEAVVPDLGHIIPIVDNTVFNGVPEGEDSLLLDGLFTNIGIFLVHSNHDVLIFGPADNGGEGGFGRIVSREPSLAHTGAVVDNNMLGVVLHRIDIINDMLIAALKGSAQNL